jgi:hypothetical protein
MTLRTASFAAALVVTHSLAWAQSHLQTTHPLPDVPTVSVGVFTLTADGRIGAAATQSGDRTGADLAGTVYLAPCGRVGGANPGHAISAFATDVWKLTGTIVEIAPEQATVQLGWQRVRRGGRDEESTPQSVTVTLKRGERSTLETIAVPAAGSCPAREALLDISFMSMKEMLGPKAAAGQTPGPATPHPFVSRRVEGRLSEFGYGSREGGVSSVLRAELWLVLSSPGRADDVRHTTAPVSAIPMGYGFTPIAIQTATGTFTLKVEGTIEAGTAPTGEPQLHFTAKRSTTFAPTQRVARDTAPVVEGSTKTTVALSGPDEVVSFELPPLRTPDGESVPDKLSVRVKLTREAMKLAHPR